MTAFVRSWLVMASVALLSHTGWAQAPQYQGMQPQFEGFAPGWGVQYNAGHAQPSRPPMPDYELLPTHSPLLDFDVFHDLGLKDFVASSWVKAEYLHATFQSPGNSILGARLSQVPNPREPFLVTAGAVVDQRAIVPDTSPLDLNAQNGVRTTIGINAFKDFSVVASWVGMQDMTSGYRITPGGLDPILFPQVFDPLLFPDNARFIATSVLDNGAIGSRVILYDRSFEVGYKAQYWSGDINILFDYHVPDTGFRMQPLIGFRYNSYDESLVQHGEFDNSSGISTTLDTLTTPSRNTILSSTQNMLCMGQVGFQAELVDKWFTIGVAPKVAIGSNTIHTGVLTSDLRDSEIDSAVDDGVTIARKNNVIFGTNFDLNGYLKLRVNPWLSLTGSAFYWYMPNVARAHNTLVYDDKGIGGPATVPVDPTNPPIPPAFRPEIKTSGLGIRGFTVGAEITF